MAPIRSMSGVNRKVRKGGPSVSIGVRSPLRAKKSPFKARRSSLAKSDISGEVNSDGSGISANIRVAVRVRPENERELTGGYRNVIQVVDDRMLIFDPENNGDDFFFHGKKVGRRDLNKRAAKDQKFAFDAVFGPNSTNEDVFENTTKDLIDVIFNGYNCSVFVYGATGAGKTHTMLGSTNNPGITFRTVMELYKKIDELKDDRTVEVAVSYLEVYNESIIDLINPESGQLAIRDDGKSANIAGLSVHRPNGPEDLLRILQYGNSNRRQHPTDANKESSRSHAVFQVVVKQKNRCSGLSSDVKVAKLSMIDLAGSEKGSATGTKGARFREGANINKSLLALGNCINSLAEGSKYIPYRNSKLTRLLKDSIGGNCRTVMISNVSPSSMTFEDTFNTLRYADRAKKIKVNLKKNVLSVNFHVGQYAKIVEDLKSEVTQLKQKIITLELENEELKSQVERHPENGMKENHVSEEINDEIETLKSQLVSLNERQVDYDDLQKRLDEYEKTKEATEAVKVSCNCGNVSDKENSTMDAVVKHSSSNNDKSVINDQKEDISESNLEISKILQTEHQEKMLKCLNEISKLKIMKARRATHEKRFKRYDAISLLDNASAEAQMAKLHKFVLAQGHKIDKSTKKCKRLISEQEQSEAKVFEVLGDKCYQKQFAEEFRQQCHEVKSDRSNNHLSSLLQLLVREQNQNEEILIESLKQLKKSHLLLRSQGQLSDETKQDFDMLVSRIQCNRLQFRDTHLVETNHDELEDVVGNLYCTASDLNIDLDSSNELLIEGLDESPDNYSSQDRNEASKPIISNVLQFSHDTIPTPSVPQVMSVQLEEFDKENNTAEIWRPPTPPKISPKTKEKSLVSNTIEDACTEKINKEMKEASPSKTPSPPQLASVDTTLWNIQSVNENNHASVPSEIDKISEHIRFDSPTNLNETFDLPSIQLDSSLCKQLDSEKVSNSSNDNSKRNLDSSYSIDSDETIELSHSNMVSDSPSSNNSCPMDVTITLDKTDGVDIDAGQIPSVDGDCNVNSPLMKHASIHVANCANYMPNVVPTPENKEPTIFYSGSNNEMINGVSTEETSDDGSETKIFHQEAKRKVSERRGTFTMGNGDSNNSPIVAVVPPSKREDLKTDLRNEENLNSSLTDVGNRLHDHSPESTINLYRSSEGTPNLSVKRETNQSTQVNTPAKINIPPTISSASGGKRTLKRSGMNSTVGSSASTSKLLKGLSAYRPLNKPKVSNAINQMPRTQPLQTSHAPSYMAATASSSRKLNFTSLNSDTLINKGNTNVTLNTTDSPNAKGMHVDTSAKENEEPKVHLNRSKDNTGAIKKLKKSGASMSALRQYNK